MKLFLIIVTTAIIGMYIGATLITAFFIANPTECLLLPL